MHECFNILLFKTKLRFQANKQSIYTQHIRFNKQARNTFEQHAPQTDIDRRIKIPPYQHAEPGLQFRVFYNCIRILSANMSLTTEF